jgi:hypothetical protein
VAEPVRPSGRGLGTLALARAQADRQPERCETRGARGEVRERLQANPWAQIGVAAIAWELEKLHLRRIPELRMIERILERAGAPRRERRVRYAAKGTPYPAAARPAPNELQEADLVGPRHLAGAIPRLRL